MLHKRSMVHELPVVVFLGVLALLTTAVAQKPEMEATEDGPIARGQFRKAVLYLAEQNEFESLEKMGAELLAKQSRFPEGLWKLERFYAGLKGFEKGGNQPSLDRKMEWLDRWAAACPQSSLATV